jgi:hypothetical protein
MAAAVVSQKSRRWFWKILNTKGIVNRARWRFQKEGQDYRQSRNAKPANPFQPFFELEPFQLRTTPAIAHV